MLKRKGLVLLTGVLVLVLGFSIPLMQCAPPQEEEVTPPAEVETPYGGRFDVGCLSEQSLEGLQCDIEWEWGAMGCIFHMLVYDHPWLLGPAPDYKPIPRLVSSWETEDGQTWTFHTVENAKWHDGEPVTAEDVAFSMEYMPKGLPPWLRSDTDCESISVVDDYTVEFTLKGKLGGKYPPFYYIPMVPKHIWEPYKDDWQAFPNEEVIGCGPFKLKEFKPAQYMWLVANEDYHGKRPYVDEVVIKSYGSDDALYMALKTGEIDMLLYYGCTMVAVEDFRKAENIDVILSPGMGLKALAFNLHKAPIKDLNLRKAIMHGIDRDAIIDMVYLGNAEKIDSVVYSESADHNPNLPQYDYDPDLARELLDNAGYIDSDNDGIRNDPATRENLALVTVVPTSRANYVKATVMMTEQLKKIGIGIITRAMDEATYYEWQNAATEDAWDIIWVGREPGPNGDWVWEYFRSWEGGNTGWNTAWYNNARYDQVMEKMIYERDLAKRKQYLYEIQMMLAEDLPYGWMYRPQIPDPARVDKFEGYAVMMGGISSWINPWSYLNVRLK